MDFKNLKEAQATLDAKNDHLFKVFEESGSDRDLGKPTVLAMLGVSDSAAAANKVRALNDEVSDIGKEVDKWRAIDKAAEDTARRYKDSHEPVRNVLHPAPDRDEHKARSKSIGRLFVESQAYQQFNGLRNWPSPAVIDLDIRNAVFRTGAGWDPEVIRLPGYIPSAQEEPVIADVIPQLPTKMDTISYMLETTFTNNAAETAESTATTAADLIGEAALALTAQTMPVEWLPVFIPVTIQQMEDVEGIEEYVNDRLRLMIRQRLSSQCLNGDGSTPNLKGTLNIGGSLQTQALGTDPVPDAVYKLLTKIRVTGKAIANVIFFHPNDWQPVRLLRTADGIYIWGSPMEAGPERIWGKTVIQSTDVTENTAVAGDYANYARLFVKRGIQLSVSDSHAFYFTRGMLAIRADMRVALVHYRTAAFGTITGI